MKPRRNTLNSFELKPVGESVCHSSLPQFWPVWLIIAGPLLVGMWFGAGAACLASCSWREEISHRPW